MMDTREVFLNSEISSLARPGMLTRMACGSTTRTKAWNGGSPSALAASSCPPCTEMTPPRKISPVWEPMIRVSPGQAEQRAGDAGDQGQLDGVDQTLEHQRVEHVLTDDRPLPVRVGEQVVHEHHDEQRENRPTDIFRPRDLPMDHRVG